MEGGIYSGQAAHIGQAVGGQMERLGRQTYHGIRFASRGRGRGSTAHDRAGGGWGVSVGAVHAWGHVGLCYWGSHSGTQQGGGHEVGGRWENREGGGTVSVGR